MNIDLSPLNYSFHHKPLVIGGCAMEYYGLRKAGADIDLVVHPDDHATLVKLYPDHIKDLYGDIGVCEYDFEIWNQICTFDYFYLGENAIEEQDYRVISLEKLIELLAVNPRLRFNIPFGEDYTLWNLNEEFTVDPNEFLSKGKATPFTGEKLYGRCYLTVSNGKIAYSIG